jgi:hypothetical protein
MSAKAICPGCHEEVRFWIIDPLPSDTEDKRCGCLCMHPSPKLNYQAMIGLDAVPQPIGGAYTSAVNAFNGRDWPGTAGHCRRVLEGIVKNLLPDEDPKQHLAVLLRQLPDKVDLTKGVTALADALKEGGNLGAHFGWEPAADEPMAKQMLELSEFVMEYIYIMPSRARHLQDSVAGGNDAKNTADDQS